MSTSRTGNADRTITSRDAARELLILARKRRRDPKSVWGVPWGFPGLDRMTGGIQPHEMSILMARPGVGKTSFLAQRALSVARWLKEEGREDVVKLVLCEMTAQQFQERLQCYLADVSVRRVRTGNTTDEQHAAYEAAAAEVAGLPIEYLDSPVSLEDTQHWLTRGSRPAWWAVDYIGIHPLSARAGTMTTTAVVATLSGGFRSVAKEVAPGLVLAQMNRNVEGREDKRPTLADLKDSSQLEADASLVLGLYREDIYRRLAAEERSRPKPAELLVLKNRSGETGTIEMLWTPQRMEYTDVSEVYDDLEEQPVASMPELPDPEPDPTDLPPNDDDLEEIAA